MEQKIICKSLDELPNIVEKLLNSFPTDRIFAFKGNLGAGKTTFIKILCKKLGVKDEVVSPTFAIINEYLTESAGPIFHFDFYRINKVEEVMDIGYEEYLYSDNYCLIEWPEKIEELLPQDIVYITIIEKQDNNSRIIYFMKR
ncbi:MAG: tRNA (adenosine(37)-N6)-threonylcarbamoyltransferase complex ATPase subunit type 1 TsaE [Bacteroidetes bacterium]|nr:tRNA (adenosine(37)-N6)-threonylcarbamoyltransferase complex ATPase subunit type 1 TsaE [Bacteroidota bacterium]